MPGRPAARSRCLRDAVGLVVIRVFHRQRRGRENRGDASLGSSSKTGRDCRIVAPAGVLLSRVCRSSAGDNKQPFGDLDPSSAAYWDTFERKKKREKKRPVQLSQFLRRSVTADPDRARISLFHPAGAEGQDSWDQRQKGDEQKQCHARPQERITIARFETVSVEEERSKRMDCLELHMGPVRRESNGRQSLNRRQ